MMKRMLSVWVISTMMILGGCNLNGQQAIDQTNQVSQENHATQSRINQVTESELNPKSGSPTRTNEQASPTGSGELVIGSLERMPAFDPFGISKKEAILNPYEWLGYRGLLATDAQQMLVPSLASGYRVLHQQGKPVIEITLRPDLYWSDGREVTAEDIVFTYQTYARPDYYGIWRKEMHLVQGVSPFRSGKSQMITGITQHANNRTVRIALERNQIRFMTALTAPLLPKHQLVGKSLDHLFKLSQEGQIVGAGPFRVKEKSADEWRLVPNTHYHEGAPKLRSIRIIRENFATIGPDTFQGKIHISGVPPGLASYLAQQKSSIATIKTAVGNGCHILGFNLQSKQVGDVEIRRALVQALPIKQIITETIGPFAVPVDSILPAASPVYHAGQFPTYDGKEARRTLEGKGYTKDRPLALVLTFPSDSHLRTQLVEKMRKAWEALPIRLTLRPLTHDQFASYLFGGSPTDLYVYAWRYAKDPSELQALFHSKEKVGELGLNASRYENPSADRLLERGQLFLDSNERKVVFTSWQQRVAADLPIFPLLQVNNPYYVSNRVKGIGEQLGTQPFANIHTWWIE